MPLLRIMNPGVCTMSLSDDYVKFCAKAERHCVTLTSDTHVASFTHLVDCVTLTSDTHVASLTHLVDCKYKTKVHRQQ